MFYESFAAVKPVFSGCTNKTREARPLSLNT